MSSVFSCPVSFLEHVLHVGKCHHKGIKRKESTVKLICIFACLSFSSLTVRGFL